MQFGTIVSCHSKVYYYPHSKVFIIQPGFLCVLSHLFCHYKGRIGLSVCRAAGAHGCLPRHGQTYVVRSRPGVVRTSDLDYREDLHSHQLWATAAQLGVGSTDTAIYSCSLTVHSCSLDTTLLVIQFHHHPSSSSSHHQSLQRKVFV